MDIPPPWVPPRPPPKPAPVEDAPEPPVEVTWRTRWADLRERMRRAFSPDGSVTPLDPLDLLHSAVVQLVWRVLRTFFLIGLGVGVGVWAMMWADANIHDPSDWPTPWAIVRDIGGIDNAPALPFLGMGLYAFSFVGCLRVVWLLPFWLLGFLVQIHWAVRAISEEDEEPWLLPTVVPLIAWQVFATGDYRNFDDALTGAVVLVGFTVCWVVGLVTRRQMILSEVRPWSLFYQKGRPFDPAFFRWRPAVKPKDPPPGDATEETDPKDNAAQASPDPPAGG